MPRNSSWFEASKTEFFECIHQMQNNNGAQTSVSHATFGCPQVSVVSSYRVTTRRTLGGRVCGAEAYERYDTKSFSNTSTTFSFTKGRFLSLSGQQVSVVRWPPDPTCAQWPRRCARNGRKTRFVRPSERRRQTTTTTTTTGRTVFYRRTIFRVRTFGVQRRPSATWRRERVIEAARLVQIRRRKRGDIRLIRRVLIVYCRRCVFSF